VIAQSGRVGMGMQAQGTIQSGASSSSAHQRRSGDREGPVPFRSSRFFCVGNRWYFTTREGFDSGPYASRERAEIGLKRFLHVVKLLPENAQSH